jgi:hypothetical protein
MPHILLFREKNLQTLMHIMARVFFKTKPALFTACPFKIQQSINIHAHVAALDSVSAYSRQLTRMRIAQVVLDFSKKLKAMQKDLHSNCKYSWCEF